VSGGPPCQPFSLGGKHIAFRDSRDLWSEAVRAVREARPKAFLFENVKGLTRQAFANYYEYIYLQLTYPKVTRKRDELFGLVTYLEINMANVDALPSFVGFRDIGEMGLLLSNTGFG
jgi:site-specific DNA-cytosine methylase